jgi:ferredoxin
MSEKPTKKIHSIKVDRTVCIGSSTCVVVAPKAFELDEEGISTPKISWRDVDDETLLMAAQSCPVSAISLYDVDGNLIYPKKG